MHEIIMHGYLVITKKATDSTAGLKRGEKGGGDKEMRVEASLVAESVSF